MAAGIIVARKSETTLQQKAQIASSELGLDLQKARNNPNVKAVVLRVDSPGMLWCSACCDVDDFDTRSLLPYLILYCCDLHCVQEAVHLRQALLIHYQWNTFCSGTLTGSIVLEEQCCHRTSM